MKKVLLLLTAVVSGLLISRAAPDYTGIWRGYITQESALALATDYHFMLTLRHSGADEIRGRSEIRLWEDQQVFGTMELVGSFNGNELNLEETEITREQIYVYARWCLKNMHLYYSIEDGKEILRGTWNSSACSGPGEVYLERGKGV